jgi:hypothetical protein
LYFRHPSGLKICCPMAYELLDAEFGEMEWLNETIWCSNY